MTSFESRLSVALEKPMTGKLLLAAVSGGADSTAMLAALAALREEAGFTLHGVHVEHGIRPADESRGDAVAVKALCERLDVPCGVISVPPGRIAAYAARGGTGIEAAARVFRLKALAGEGRRLEADWILTAHTRDDLLENLLMRILRGSGPAGLRPMPRVKGRRLRPLLEMTRQDILQYLKEKNIPYRTDTTNADIRYLRNRVRLKLIPVLDDFFPSWRASLLALAETQALTAEFLSDEVRKRLHWEALEAGAALRLPEEDFFNSPVILREEAVLDGTDTLMATNRKKHGHPPRRASLRHVVERGSSRRDTSGSKFSSGNAEGWTANDLGPVRLERKDGFIVLKPAVKARSEAGFSLLINEAGSYTLKGRVSGLGKDLSISADSPAGDPATRERPDGAAGLSAGKTTGFPFGKAIGFAAAFPVVFRNHRKGDCIFKGGRERRFYDVDKFPLSVYTRVITVSDKGGPVAFIAAGEDLTIINGEDRTGDSERSFFGISWKRDIHGNTGGTDARRSER